MMTIDVTGGAAAGFALPTATAASTTSRCARTRCAASSTFVRAFQHSVSDGAAPVASASADPAESANNQAVFGRPTAAHVCDGSGWLTPFASTYTKAPEDAAGVIRSFSLRTAVVVARTSVTVSDSRPTMRQAFTSDVFAAIRPSVRSAVPV